MKRLTIILAVCFLLLVGCSAQVDMHEIAAGVDIKSTEPEAAWEPLDNMPSDLVLYYNPAGSWQEEETVPVSEDPVIRETTRGTARIDAPVETIESDDELEVAQAIVDDLKKRKGVEITEDSDIHGVSEMLFEYGYMDVDAWWLMETLFGEVKFPSRQVEHDPEEHHHNYERSVDHDNMIVHLECECGDVKDIPVPDISVLMMLDDGREEYREEQTLPVGNEYRKMTAGEYFRQAFVPWLYQEWGENHYYWYFDEPTAMIVVTVTVDGVDELLDQVDEPHPDERALQQWTGLKKEIKDMSIYLQDCMEKAGFLSARVIVGLGDSSLAQVYTVENGYVWHDIVAELEESRAGSLR